MKNSSITDSATATERSTAESARIETLIDELLDKVHGGTGKCFPCVKPIPGNLCANPRPGDRPQ